MAPNVESAKNIPCKNVLIYGYCKYENKGCVFNHNRGSNSPTEAQGNGNSVNAGAGQNRNNSGYSGSETRKRFNLDTPSFQPGSSGISSGSKYSSMSPKLNDIPVFVPSGNNNGYDYGGTPNGMDEFSASSRRFNAKTPPFKPSNPYLQSSDPSLVGGGPLDSGGGQQNPYLSMNVVPQQQMGPVPSHTADMFYLHSTSNYPLNYHLYAPAPPPHLTMPIPPHCTYASTMFIPNDLREALQKKNEATLQTLPNSNLPEHVNVYHSLYPLDTVVERPSKTYGAPCSVFKAFSNVDGNAYTMRKINIHSLIRISNEAPFRTIEKWKSINCANVVQIQDAFTSMAFGGPYSTLLVTYDFFPLAKTLQEQHITRKLGDSLEEISEELLYCYMIQIINALLCIHSAGLAARSSLEVSKIIVSNKHRIRLASVGVSDIINYELDEKSVHEKGLEAFRRECQNEDKILFAKLILDLACLSIPPAMRSGTPIELLEKLKASTTTKFSEDFIIALLELFHPSTDLKDFSARHLINKLYHFGNNLQDLLDYFESQLTSELENARLFRLMTKLNFIVDRPESENDPLWRPNGPKYIIKLFRDYVFFQRDEVGKPVCDLSRVLTILNKLDAGIEEKILLISDDEKFCIIVSFREVRAVIENVFHSLVRS